MADYGAFKKAAIRGQDEIVACPFNPAHQINKSRLQYHIVKCEKQHALRELVTCPYNATHRIPKPELPVHVFECPDKRILETHKFQVDNVSHDNRNLPEFINPTLPPSEENWDSENYQSTYEPEKHIGNKCLFRNIQGATKSERKQFRREERRRVNQLSTETSEPDVSNHAYVPPRPPKSMPKGMTNPDPNETYIPPRLPKSLPKGMVNTESGARLGMGRGLPPSH